ncbi:MAG: transposase [Acidobacteriota bacterium]|nr:transposase [Acidobacteriota bacterium]
MRRLFAETRRKHFCFAAFNLKIIEQTVAVKPIAFAQDASFIKKSGKHTFGLDQFWNGSHKRVEKGLELSLISAIDAGLHTSFAVSAEQTPPNLKAEKTRIDFYLEHLQRTAGSFPDSIKYGIFDGFYAKQKFVNGVLALGFYLISRLRSDANLKYLYTGEEGGRGRPRRFDGKVDFADLARFAETDLEEKNVKLYAAVLWSVTLKRKIKLVIVKVGRRATNLFSTDLELSAEEIFRLYRRRFTIEFLIRDAKQSAGLQDCQARDQKALEFHWNASFATVNLARLEAKKVSIEGKSPPFSMKSIKQLNFNEHLLKLFICKLGLEQTLIKYQEHFENLRNFAVISP